MKIKKLAVLFLLPVIILVAVLFSQVKEESFPSKIDPKEVSRIEFT